MGSTKKKLVVVGDSKACGGCKSEKEFISRNEDALRKAGIDEVVFVNPTTSKANERIATMYQDKHIRGMKAQPLNVVVSGSEDVAFLGFSSKGFLKEIKKSVSHLDKIGGKAGKKSKGKGKKRGLFR